MQKLSSKTQTKLTLRNAVLLLYGGLGIFAILFMIAFLLYNLGRPEKSTAAGSIGSVRTGLWSNDNTWNLNRRPANHEEIIITHKQEVTINYNLNLENVTIKVYGTLKLRNSNLRLDERSTILVAKTGKIISEGTANNMLVIESQPWIGNQINAIGAPVQLTASGLSSVDLLPVELAYFKGKPTGNNTVLLEWGTLSELNNAYFTVEKKVGESDFILVDTLRGAGNSDEEKFYSYEDKHVFASTVFYRLKQTDFDGNFKYFNIINVTADLDLTNSEQSIQITQAGPNPFTDKFMLLYKSHGNSAVWITISDMNGKSIHKEELVSLEGENEYILADDISLKAGIYLVKVSQNNSSDFVKMIKK